MGRGTSKDKTARPDNDPDRMPPWFIEKNIGIQNFKEDISLSPEELATIAAWVDSGARRGDPADLPPAIAWPDGKDWSFGEPDLVVSSPKHTLEAVAADWYGLLDRSPTGLTEDRWVKAVEVREVLLDEATVERKSGDLNLFVVHHAVISARERSKAIQTQSRPTGERGPADLFSVVHEVGQNATFYPEVLGVRLPAGSALNWDLHLHSIGVEVPFRIDVAFKFHPEGWEPKYSGRGGILSYLTFDIDIPPEEPNAKMEGMQLVTKPGIMMTFEPHLHSSGKRMCIEAMYPSGLSEMLNCARLQPQLSEGVSLRGGSRAAAAGQHVAAGHRLVRQHPEQPARRRSTQLEGVRATARPTTCSSTSPASSRSPRSSTRRSWSGARSWSGRG